MKLYVWENCFTDYTDGLAVALAESVDEARILIAKAFGNWHPEDLDREPKEYALDKPIGFAVYGGG